MGNDVHLHALRRIMPAGLGHDAPTPRDLPVGRQKEYRLHRLHDLIPALFVLAGQEHLESLWEQGFHFQKGNRLLTVVDHHLVEV